MEKMRNQASPLRNRINFDELKSWGSPEKHAAAACNGGTISTFAWRRKTKKSLSQDGRSQDPSLYAPVFGEQSG
jgi:hypothetical protein